MFYNVHLSFFRLQENLDKSEKTALISTNMNKYVAYAWAVFCDSSTMNDFYVSFLDYGLKNPDGKGLSRWQDLNFCLLQTEH
jgi:hypothetical protein